MDSVENARFVLSWTKWPFLNCVATSENLCHFTVNVLGPSISEMLFHYFLYTLSINMYKAQVVISWACQVSEACDALHEKGVVCSRGCYASLH